MLQKRREYDKMSTVKGSDYMLLQFKFKNHKCFYDECVLDLMATSEKRHSEELLEKNNYKVLPVIAIHGANASGKSSVLEALSFMFETIKNNQNTDVTNDIMTNPFAFSEKQRDSEYEVSINVNDYEYRYGFSANKDGFNQEWLYKKKFVCDSRAKQSLIFEREKENITFGSNYSKYENTWKLFNKASESSKLLVISMIARKEENGIFRDIYDYICKFSFKAENIFRPRMSIDILNNDDILFDKFQKIINEFDPCLIGINIKELEDENGRKIYSISGKHRNIDKPNETILLPLVRESDGTIKIFNIMPTILKNLLIGGILCVDELDVELHPLLFRKIVNMYKDKSINKNNAQLIFTSHSTFMLNSNDLRRDQIYLVQKDEFGKSELYSLSEFRNLRVDADYEKKYLTGEFGAIPFDN